MHHRLVLLDCGSIDFPDGRRNPITTFCLLQSLSILFHYTIQPVSLMFCGGLGKLELASAAMAISVSRLDSNSTLFKIQHNMTLLAFAAEHRSAVRRAAGCQAATAGDRYRLPAGRAAANPLHAAVEVD